MAKPSTPLSDFFRALSTVVATGPLPTELFMLARRVHRRAASSGLQPGDLVGELLYRLAKRAKAEGSGQGYSDLVDLGEARLRALLRFRLRQIAMEADPRWKLCKAIREMLRDFRVEPGAWSAGPNSLLEGGRLSRARVLAEASRLCREEPHLAQHPALLAARLLENCPTALAAEADPDELPGPFELPDTTAEAEADLCLAREELRSRLGSLLPVLAARQRGLGYAEIAKAQGVGLGTAHRRVGRAIQVVRDLARSGRFSLACLGLALEGFGS